MLEFRVRFIGFDHGRVGNHTLDPFLLELPFDHSLAGVLGVDEAHLAVPSTMAISSGVRP